jgi:hypothetical protein
MVPKLVVLLVAKRLQGVAVKQGVILGSNICDAQLGKSKNH